MAPYQPSDHLNFTSQSEIDSEIAKLQCWDATLPFDNVEGFPGSVDLFHYTDKSFKPKPKSKDHDAVPSLPLIIFDRQKYPPTKDGLKKLNADLIASAKSNGSELQNRHTQFRLNCFRCRCHDRSKKKGKKNQEAVEDTTNKNELSDVVAVLPPSHLDDESVETHVNANLVDSADHAGADFDENGVKVGIREHHFHRDKSYRRERASGLKKGSSTRLPLVKENWCKVALVLDEHEDGYYYMKTGLGNKSHVFHSRTNPEHQKTTLNEVSDKTKQLVKQGHDACAGTNALRSMVFASSNEYLSVSTLRRLQMVPECLQSSGDPKSTARQLVNWLRSKASDPAIKLGYVVLNHYNTDPSHTYHKHSKGRPSNDAPRLDLAEVNERLTYVPIGNQTNKTNLEMVRKRSSLINAGVEEDTSMLCDDSEFDHGDEGDDTYDMLSNDSDRTRNVVNQFRLDKQRVLLGAAWIDQDAWKMFQKYPEVIFIDSTHKSNNEGRPLLLIVGRDSNGKAYIIMRIFMPNKTGGFFRWTFLRCLPYLLGKDILSKVKIIITDGDSQEFNAVDEAIFKYFKNALRLRCGIHIVMKTMEKSIPSSNFMPGKDSAEAQLQMIRNWVFSWMNGHSCFTEEQYELSKALLLQYLDQDEKLEECVGSYHLEQIKIWVNTSIIPNEKWYVFHKKTYVECFDEYVNNSVEGMNYTQKKAEVSAKPNMNMATSATKMLKNKFDLET